MVFEDQYDYLYSSIAGIMQKSKDRRQLSLHPWKSPALTHSKVTSYHSSWKANSQYMTYRLPLID